MYDVVWLCFGILSIGCGMVTSQWLSPVARVECAIFQSSSELSGDGA